MHWLWNHPDPKEREAWRKAIFSEAKQTAVDRACWKHVPRGVVPKNAKMLRGRWVFARKYDAQNKLIKCKARCVIKGFLQKF